MPTTTFSISVAADDGSGYYGSTSWPPNGGTFGVDDDTILWVTKGLSGTIYYNDFSLLRFNTSSLGSGATITDVVLKLYCVAKNGGSSGATFALVGDYYDFGGEPTVAGDWTETVSSSIFSGVLFANLTTSVVNNITLSDLSGINKTGFTGIRLTLSAGTPTAANDLQFAALEHATFIEPQLEVTYTTGTSISGFDSGTLTELSSVDSGSSKSANDSSVVSIETSSIFVNRPAGDTMMRGTGISGIPGLYQFGSQTATRNAVDNFTFSETGTASSDSWNTIIEINGSITGASLVTQINGAPAGSVLVRPVVGQPSFTITGTSFSFPRTDVRLQNSVFQDDTCEFLQDRCSLMGGTIPGFSIWEGADDILLDGVTIDCRSIVGRNDIRPRNPGQAKPQRPKILRCNFSNIDENSPGSHIEALYIGPSDNGEIGWCTFTDDAGDEVGDWTAWIFFTWWEGGGGSRWPLGWQVHDCVFNRHQDSGSGFYFTRLYSGPEGRPSNPYEIVRYDNCQWNTVPSGEARCAPDETALVIGTGNTNF